MSITDPEAIRFTNEQIRPLAERFRNLYFELEALVPYWVDTIGSMIPNDPSELIEDGREDVTTLSGEDIGKFISEAVKFMNGIEEVGSLSAITKPCVRPLRSS